MPIAIEGEKGVPDISSASYVPQSPEWAVLPPPLWSLMEIKNGVQVAVHDLSSRSSGNIIVLGRGDGVDIVLHHASISRFHARIAFDKRGTPWLRDLSSSHGVFVNKRRLPPTTVGRIESTSTVAGSRGVVIFPGDIIQLGASTRYFCVVGPSEFERPTSPIGTLPNDTELEELTVSAGSTSDARNGNIDLGDGRLDDEEEFTVNIVSEHSLSDETVPTLFRLDWEKIKALQQKLENIQRESERIRMKGDSDSLSSGQVKQLERNEERAANIQEQIRTKESELHQKIHPTNNSNHMHSRKKNSSDVDTEEDYDYLDRTKTNDRNCLKLDNDGETEQSLLLKWSELQSQRHDISRKLECVNQKACRLKRSMEDLDEEEDSFFVQNELDVLYETSEKLKRKDKLLVQNLTELGVLIRVVNPKLRLVGDCTSWTIPTPNDAFDVSAHSDRKPGSKYINVTATSDDSEKKVSNTGKLYHDEHQKTSHTESASHRMMLPPPPKRQKNSNVLCAPKEGTLAFLSSSSIYPTISENSPGPGGRTPTPAGAGGVALPNDGRHDMWQVPKDQDGSGRTKLNDKFSGRY